MEISRLSLRQFRNLDPIDIVPDPGFNIFWGDNAQGKTNILEGIYLLGSMKSFRGARNEEMIRHGTDACRLMAEVGIKGSNRRIELTIDAKGKTARVDGKDVRRPVDYFGILCPVLFSPEEINLVKGPPAGRRAMLDRALFQADINFLDRAREYDRHLRQRNQLLRKEAPENELAPWTDGLIRTGARLRLERYRYLQRLRPFLQEAYHYITGATEEADIAYPAGNNDEKNLLEAMAKEVARHQDRERRTGQSLAGPHRDDPEFRINSLPLRNFGSQGQQRSFLLAFKTAQIRDLEENTGEAPVLLLDDMTSELDRKRQEMFFNYLLERQGQVFITTTDSRPHYEQGFSRARFLRVEKGRLIRDSQR